MILKWSISKLLRPSIFYKYRPLFLSSSALGLIGGILNTISSLIVVSQTDPLQAEIASVFDHQ
jgi:hypothetical protein